MMKRADVKRDHPLRDLFRRALSFGFKLNPSEKTGIADYIEEQILCEFIHADNLYKIRDASEKRLEDIADMLAEGNVLINAQSFKKEFQVHKHIGDYTLFMLGMFPAALSMRKGREFVLGRLIIPDSNLSDHYTLQGRQSYRIASEFTDKELFQELSTNFEFYKNVLDLVRMYLESSRNREFLKAAQIIGGTD